tara:strand:- start:152 stop:898 length:747 start_codon:yes stop_codon:yes gene_type:complete
VTNQTTKTFPKVVPQGLIDKHSHYERAIAIHGNIGRYKTYSNVLYQLFTTANPSAIFTPLGQYNDANKLDVDDFCTAFEDMLHDALGHVLPSEWDLMKPKDKRAALVDIGKDISKLIGRLKRHNLDLSIQGHIDQGLVDSMQIFEGDRWRPARECATLEATTLCDVLTSVTKELKTFDATSLVVQPGSKNVKLHYFTRRAAEFMSDEYGLIDYDLVASLANVYFPGQDVDSDMVRFQLRPLIQPQTNT